ncbi:hypothetical protein LJC08_00960 [Methanimicrococcus sp. OttesenSCG-928-J09]|nr:hypothetical protein [Methanimicrococcus sp. OttesenSCG-928-J09]
MNRESAEEIFTRIGKMPDPTPEEQEETKQMIKKMNEDLELQLQRMLQGLNGDGTERREGEEEEMIKRLYESYLRIPEIYRNPPKNYYEIF